MRYRSASHIFPTKNTANTYSFTYAAARDNNPISPTQHFTLLETTVDQCEIQNGYLYTRSIGEYNPDGARYMDSWQQGLVATQAESTCVSGSTTPNRWQRNDISMQATPHGSHENIRWLVLVHQRSDPWIRN